MKKLITAWILAIIIACSPQSDDRKRVTVYSNSPPEIVDISSNYSMCTVTVYDRELDFDTLYIEYRTIEEYFIDSEYIYCKQYDEEASCVFKLKYRNALLFVTPEDKMGNIGETWTIEI